MVAELSSLKYLKRFQFRLSGGDESGEAEIAAPEKVPFPLKYPKL